MTEIRETEDFRRWPRGIRDPQARATLLTGGDKRSQADDIRQALRLARGL